MRLRPVIVLASRIAAMTASEPVLQKVARSIPVSSQIALASLPAMASEYAVKALRRRQREQAGVGPSAETRQLMGDARSRRAAEIRTWEAAHPVIPSPQRFATEILPTLAAVRAQDVRDATGLSISYCRRVLRGQFVPHPMHWDAVRALVLGK